MHKQHQVNQVSERKLFGLRIIKRFNKSEDGVAAIEFGMLALPFLMLIFAILETAIGFFAAQVFESGIDSVGREIRTGQISSSTVAGTQVTAAEVRTKICAKTWGLFDCNAIQLDVQTHAVFPAAPLTTPRDVDGNFDNSALQFNTGLQNEIVIIRAYYEWPIFLDYMWQNVSGLSNGARLFVATTAFQNEPF